MRDYEKVFHSVGDNNIFEKRSIDRNNGYIIVVRPDQYIANILPLDAHNDLSHFFDNFMI